MRVHIRNETTFIRTCARHLLWSHALSSSSSTERKAKASKHYGYVAGRPTLPQGCIRNDHRRPKIPNFQGGACSQTLLVGTLCAVHYSVRCGCVHLRLFFNRTASNLMATTLLTQSKCCSCLFILILPSNT